MFFFNYYSGSWCGQVKWDGGYVRGAEKKINKQASELEKKEEVCIATLSWNESNGHILYGLRITACGKWSFQAENKRAGGAAPSQHFQQTGVLLMWCSQRTLVFTSRARHSCLNEDCSPDLWGFWGLWWHILFPPLFQETTERFILLCCSPRK